MSKARIRRERTVKRCNEVTKKARDIAHKAVRKVRKTKFSRMIRRNVTQHRHGWLQGDLAMQTGVVMCTSAILGIFTGSILVEAIRAGASFVISSAVSNAVLRKTKKAGRGRRNEKKSPMDKAMETAKRDTYYLHR